MPEKELTGEAAIVMGAAHNIGRATCLALVEAGAVVCVNAATSGADAEKLAAAITDAGGQAMHFVADITDPDAVGRMVDAVVERYGKLSILINNAGVRGNLPLDDLGIDEWRRVTLPSAEGTMICAKSGLAAYPPSRRRDDHFSWRNRQSHRRCRADPCRVCHYLDHRLYEKPAHQVGGDNIRYTDVVRGAAAGSRPNRYQVLNSSRWAGQKRSPR